MKKDNALLELEHLLKKKQYQALLDKIAFAPVRLQNNPSVNVICAYAWIQTGKAVLGIPFIRTALKKDKNYQPALLLSAYLDLLLLKESKALLTYTKLIESSHYGKRVKWILKKLKHLPARKHLDSKHSDKALTKLTSTYPASVFFYFPVLSDNTQDYFSYNLELGVYPPFVQMLVLGLSKCWKLLFLVLQFFYSILKQLLSFTFAFIKAFVTLCVNNGVRAIRTTIAVIGMLRLAIILVMIAAILLIWQQRTNVQTSIKTALQKINMSDTQLNTNQTSWQAAMRQQNNATTIIENISQKNATIYSQNENEYQFVLTNHLTNKETYTKKNFINLYKQMKEYIITGRINEAIYLKNRFLGSEANFVWKDKLRLLSKSIPTPSLERFENTRSYESLIADEYAENLYVKWRGKFLNVPSAKQIERINKKDNPTYLPFLLAKSETNGKNNIMNVFFAVSLPPLQAKKEYWILGRLRHGSNKNNKSEANQKKHNAFRQQQVFVQMASLKEVNTTVLSE